MKFFFSLKKLILKNLEKNVTLPLMFAYYLLFNENFLGITAKYFVLLKCFEIHIQLTKIIISLLLYLYYIKVI